MENVKSIEMAVAALPHCLAASPLRSGCNKLFGVGAEEWCAENITEHQGHVSERADKKVKYDSNLYIG